MNDQEAKGFQKRKESGSLNENFAYLILKPLYPWGFEEKAWSWVIAQALYSMLPSTLCPRSPLSRLTSPYIFPAMRFLFHPLVSLLLCFWFLLFVLLFSLSNMLLLFILTTCPSYLGRRSFDLFCVKMFSVIFSFFNYLTSKLQSLLSWYFVVGSCPHAYILFDYSHSVFYLDAAYDHRFWLLCVFFWSLCLIYKICISAIFHSSLPYYVLWWRTAVEFVRTV